MRIHASTTLHGMCVMCLLLTPACMGQLVAQMERQRCSWKVTVTRKLYYNSKLHLYVYNGKTQSVVEKGGGGGGGGNYAVVMTNCNFTCLMYVLRI